MNTNALIKKPIIGVGLRHPHFTEALTNSAAIDFVEVHSENFFAKGGALRQILMDIANCYPVSLHSTAMGLGSASGIPDSYLNQLIDLTSDISPFLMSDHASFAWGNIENDVPVHAGDLLPLVYNNENLSIMVKHVDQIQQSLGRQLLVENLSAYIALPGSTMSEQTFLTKLSERTQCGLLLDLNNILVNLHNDDSNNSLEGAKNWLDGIPTNSVGEIHLAGFSVPSPGNIAVDDHSQPVSEVCWELYAYSLKKFGSIPTLIEWDNQLPEWQVLIKQADKARDIAKRVLSNV